MTQKPVRLFEGEIMNGNKNLFYQPNLLELRGIVRKKSKYITLFQSIKLCISTIIILYFLKGKKYIFTH